MEIFYLIYCIQMVCVTNEFVINKFYKTDKKIDDKRFYEAVKRFYFESRLSAVETVYGPENDSLIDLDKSRGYINQLFFKDGNATRGTKRALDCGAGIGRVAYNVLIDYFDKVDLVEQNEKFANAALDLIGEEFYEKLGIMYKVGAQDFYPENVYDLIWVQGILEYMTDADVISLLARLRSALQPKGVIVIKENISEDGETVFLPDEQFDPRIVRTPGHFLRIMDKVGLKVVKKDVELEENPHEPPWDPILVLAVIPRNETDPFTDFLNKYKGLMVTLFCLNLFIFYFCVTGFLKYFKK